MVVLTEAALAKQVVARMPPLQVVHAVPTTAEWEAPVGPMERQ